MPRTIDDLDILQDYISRVMERAEHHANNVDEICLAVAGAILWRKEGDLKVMAREGEMKNALWVRISGHQYAVSYIHETGQIVVRDGSIRGENLAFFTNRTSLAEVKQFFGSL